MLWTRRRVREPQGRHRAGPASVVAPTPPEPVRLQPVPAPLAPAPTRVAAGSGVHLGFRDGSALELASGDPRIGAFRAVARTLRG